MLSLANCSLHQLPMIQRRLHPARSRRELIFAAGALYNKKLRKDLGSQELSTFYDGMVATGRLERNPYWPEEAKKS